MHRHLVEQFRVMGDEDDLRLFLLGTVQERHEPGLDLGQSDEVVRLIDAEERIL
jgi:hypothetical protein